MFTSFLIEFVKFRSSSLGRGPIDKIKIYSVWPNYIIKATTTIIVVNDKIKPLHKITSISLLFFVAVLGDRPSLVTARAGVLLFKFVHSLHQLRKYYKWHRNIPHNTKGPCDNGTFPLGKERGNSLHQTDHKQSKPELAGFTTRVKTNDWNNISLSPLQLRVDDDANKSFL